MKNYLSSARATAALLIVLFAVSNLSAQNPNKVMGDLGKKNLIIGIKSPNEGLKRSSIYYAGKYKVEESIPTLLEVLDKEENPNNRILIALVIYKIGNPEGLEAVKNLSEKDKDSQVRRMAAEIYNTFKIDYVQQVMLAENQE